MSKQGSIISRKNLLLKLQNRKSAVPATSSNFNSRSPKVPVIPELQGQDLTVLVLNSSHDMAKEITMQLTLSIPGCSIVYAPSIEIAKWILKKKKISLVISNAILPDGGVSRLNEVLPELEQRPDVVVVGGGMSIRSAQVFGRSGYSFATFKQLGPKPAAQVAEPVESQETPEASPRPNPIKRRIKDLGADIRNDLNNPLQEIVAMVFVAQAAQQVAPGTSEALQAIDKAAKNMADYVRGLENKIEEAVIANERVIVQ